MTDREQRHDESWLVIKINKKLIEFRTFPIIVELQSHISFVIQVQTTERSETTQDRKTR